ncbi:hypothetical protein [Luteolibacter soli]|uniref:Uncharacterized protein n=1 Tax=Luteolibacter soli TaxID=3135280 RepID=A0ABU9AXY6_9BACT
MKTRLPAALLSLALSSPLFAGDPVQPPLLEFAAGLPGKQIRLKWNSESGVRYRIERSTDLGSAGGGGGGGGAGGWKQLALVEATGTQGEWLDPEPTTTKSFYRIVQPQAEVFEIPEPVLQPLGGDILIHGQCILDGSKLVISVNGVPQEVALVAMGGGYWRASIVGGMLPGGAVVSAIAVRDPSGVDVVTLNIPISITATGRASDAPPSLPPGAPLASSNPIPGVGIVVKKGGSSTARSGSGEIGWLGDDGDISSPSLLAAFLSKKGYDYYQAQSQLNSASLSSGGGGNASPLYDAQGLEVSSALYQGGTHKHAINTKGAGANTGRVVPSSCGMPGEVSLSHVSLELPCAAGPALSWVCTYRSKAPVSSGLGAGWDFSYNISVEPVPLAAGPNAPRVIVRDGGGRADTFYRQADGTYRCDGMFREGSFRNGVFTLTFANAGRWIFRALDGSPGAGKISAIVDRNQVGLTCAYDSSGQLSTVSDAFGRSLAVEWGGSPSPHIISVSAEATMTSFTYAKISYGYSPSGRLASVTSPYEPGTPPAVGPVTFDYSEGQADPNLNGNLLSVHDGAGRLLEGFEYATSTNPLDPAYDTCSAHDCNREAVVAQALRRTTFAVLLSGGYECCENDELGRVTVSTFDKMHRLLRERCYTGFATPDVPVTTSSLPDPATRLRPTDPAYFERSCTYNADSLCTSITYPDGSCRKTVMARDFSKDCPVRERGNARVVTLVSSGGEARTVTCDHLPGYGSPESARPGNPIGGLTIKGGKNPGGNIVPAKLIWSPKSNFVSDDCDDRDELSAMRSINGINSMPSRLSMTPTTARQTQGSSFGEKVAVGLQAGAGALAQGYGVKSPRDASSGLATGRRQHSPLAIIDDSDCDDVSLYRNNENCHWSFTCPDPSDFGAAASHAIGACDDSDYVGPCDASFVTRIVTAHGQAFSYGYDGSGNLTSETSPVAGAAVAFAYNTRGQMTSCTVNDDIDTDSSFSKVVVYDDSDGFASSVTTDPTGLAITTSFDYDPLGRAISVTGPLNDVWSFGYDLRGTLVSVTSPPCPMPITTTAVLDAGGCVARVDTDHRGADGKPVADNPLYSTFYVYDSRGRLSRVAGEERPVESLGLLDPSSLGLENFAVTDFTFDAAGQVVRVSTPAACRGQTVDLACDYSYDERGLPYQITEGGSGATTPVVTKTDYDLSGAPVRVAAVASGMIAPQVSFTWDGFHRLSSVTDPMGNVASLSYDNQGFVTETVYGEMEDVPGSAGNVMLYRTSSRSGGPGLRAYNQNNARSNHAKAYNQNSARSNHAKAGASFELFFDRYESDDIYIAERFTPGAPGQPALETTVVHRSPAGLPRSETCNADPVCQWDYDSAGRLTSFTDGATTTTLTLDKKGQVLVCGQTDHFRIQGMPDKTFTMTCSYDALGRCVSVTDGVGNSSSSEWDSVGRCVSVTQPGGLVVHMNYDGGTAAGPFSQQVTADVDGDGKQDVLCASLSRCGETVFTEDSYGYRTSFTRDSLGRTRLCQCPDGTHVEVTYDSLGRASDYHRRNGQLTHADFNLRGQVTSVSHSQLPAGVLPVAPKSFVYNGMGDCISCTQGSSVVQCTYDSLGNPLSETSGGHTVTCTYDQRGRTGITYPDGRRYAESRDALGFLQSVSTLTAVGVPISPPVVVFQYAGDRVWRSTQANGVVTTYNYRGDGPPGGADLSFDTCTEIVVTNSLIAHELAHVVQQRNGAQHVVSRQTLFTESPQGPGRMQNFTRDAMGRITGCFTRRREALGGPPLPELAVSYTLGKEGRRIQEVRNGVVGNYTQDSALPPGDQQMDQYSSWPGGGIAWGDDGNVHSMERGSTGTDSYQYDAEGRVTAVTRSSTAGTLTLVAYVYDAIGRRVSSTTGGGGGLPPVTTEFVYDGDECIQEWSDDGSGTGTTSPAVTFACAEGIKYGIITRNGTIYYPVPNAAFKGRHIGSPIRGGNREASLGRVGFRTCSCPPGYFYSSARNKVEHWGDPHENVDGFVCPGGGRVWPTAGYWSMVTDSAAAVTDRFDCDDAGTPVFLNAAGLPTGASSATVPIRWCAPECMWEPSIRMIVCPAGLYSPDLGMTVSQAQDHNSSRSNKSSN